MTTSSSHATDKQLKASEQWLTQALEGEQRAVAFHELAREIGCHVHLAKNLLWTYQSTHRTAIPTYLLSGPLLSTSTIAQTQLPSSQAVPDSQSLAHMSATQRIRIVDMDQISDDERNSEADAEEERDELDLEHSGDGIVEDETGAVESEAVARWGVVLVGQEALDEKKKLFVPGQETVHIYALTPAPVKDPAQLLACALAVREHKASRDPAVYGTITGEPLDDAAGAAGGSSKAMRDGGMDFGGGKKEVKSEVKKEVKTEVKKEVKQEEPSKPTASGSKATAKNKRRIIVSDDEDDEPISSKPVSKGSTSSSSSTKAKGTATKLEPTSSTVRADDQAAMEAMMGMDVDFDSSPVRPKAAAAASVAAKEKSKSGGERKRRRVKKSKVEMDDKGYMVTKDYWTDESYSGGSETETEIAPAAKKKTAAASSSKAESSTAKKPAAPAPAKPAASTGGRKPAPAKPGAKKAMGQSTLMGFFKK